jgi:hypothetical protein
MALIFFNYSTCPVCDQTLSEDDEIIELPPIAGTLNPLHRYFDSGYHKLCFKYWDKKEAIQAILGKEIPADQQVNFL